MYKAAAVSLLFLICTFSGISQADSSVLTLKGAVDIALSHYGIIRAKSNYVKANQASLKQSQREYLPDLSFSGQQDYGTINGQNGPVYGYRGLSVASSGPPLSSQSWNAAFGGLYLANLSWDFFAFGKAKEKIKVAGQNLALSNTDLEQEKFQQEVRVAGAYLNLLAAQRLRHSQQDNLDRAEALRNVVVTRARNGLNPGVDSSLANAEVSNAKISLTQSVDYEQEQANVLAQQMGVEAPRNGFQLDTFFVVRIPVSLKDSAGIQPGAHPLLKYYQQRISLSDELAKYYHTQVYPVFSLFSVFQGRGSGFDYNYSQAAPNAFTHGYFDGINPTRSNYLIGVGLTWNFTSVFRVQQQVLAQQFYSKGLQDEYDLVNLQLKNQLLLSDTKITNALANYKEAPIQVKAASDAYVQKSVMYKNGLSTIVDITQALYTLNRAETDRDIAYANVWQALLLKAAASGDFQLFVGAL